MNRNQNSISSMQVVDSMIQEAERILKVMAQEVDISFDVPPNDWAVSKVEARSFSAAFLPFHVVCQDELTYNPETARPPHKANGKIRNREKKDLSSVYSSGSDDDSLGMFEPEPELDVSVISDSELNEEGGGIVLLAGGPQALHAAIPRLRGAYAGVEGLHKQLFYRGILGDFNTPPEQMAEGYMELITRLILERSGRPMGFLEPDEAMKLLASQHFKLPEAALSALQVYTDRKGHLTSDTLGRFVLAEMARSAGQALRGIELSTEEVAVFHELAAEMCFDQQAGSPSPPKVKSSPKPEDAESESEESESGNESLLSQQLMEISQNFSMGEVGGRAGMESELDPAPAAAIPENRYLYHPSHSYEEMLSDGHSSHGSPRNGATPTHQAAADEDQAAPSHSVPADGKEANIASPAERLGELHSQFKALSKAYEDASTPDREQAANCFEEAKSAYVDAVRLAESTSSDIAGLLLLLDRAAQKMNALSNSLKGEKLKDLEHVEFERRTSLSYSCSDREKSVNYDPKDHSQSSSVGLEDQSPFKSLILNGGPDVHLMCGTPAQQVQPGEVYDADNEGPQKEHLNVTIQRGSGMLGLEFGRKPNSRDIFIQYIDERAQSDIIHHFKTGDKIISLNGVVFAKSRDLCQALGNAEEGDQLRFEIERLTQDQEVVPPQNGEHSPDFDGPLDLDMFPPPPEDISLMENDFSPSKSVDDHWQKQDSLRQHLDGEATSDPSNSDPRDSAPWENDGEVSASFSRAQQSVLEDDKVQSDKEECLTDVLLQKDPPPPEHLPQEENSRELMPPPPPILKEKILSEDGTGTASQGETETVLQSSDSVDMGDSASTKSRGGSASSALRPGEEEEDAHSNISAPKEEEYCFDDNHGVTSGSERTDDASHQARERQNSNDAATSLSALEDDLENISSVPHDDGDSDSFLSEGDTLQEMVSPLSEKTLTEDKNSHQGHITHDQMESCGSSPPPDFPEDLSVKRSQMSNSAFSSPVPGEEVQRFPITEQNLAQLQNGWPKRLPRQTTATPHPHATQPARVAEQLNGNNQEEWPDDISEVSADSDTATAPNQDLHASLMEENGSVAEFSEDDVLGDLDQNWAAAAAQAEVGGEGGDTGGLWDAIRNLKDSAQKAEDQWNQYLEAAPPCQDEGLMGQPNGFPAESESICWYRQLSVSLLCWTLRVNSSRQASAFYRWQRSFHPLMTPGSDASSESAEEAVSKKVMTLRVGLMHLTRLLHYTKGRCFNRWRNVVRQAERKGQGTVALVASLRRWRAARCVAAFSRWYGFSSEVPYLLDVKRQRIAVLRMMTRQLALAKEKAEMSSLRSFFQRWKQQQMELVQKETATSRFVSIQRNVNRREMASAFGLWYNYAKWRRVRGDLNMLSAQLADLSKLTFDSSSHPRSHTTIKENPLAEDALHQSLGSSLGSSDMPLDTLISQVTDQVSELFTSLQDFKDQMKKELAISTQPNVKLRARGMERVNSSHSACSSISGVSDGPQHLRGLSPSSVRSLESYSPSLSTVNTPTSHGSHQRNGPVHDWHNEATKIGHQHGSMVEYFIDGLEPYMPPLAWDSLSSSEDKQECLLMWAMYIHFCSPPAYIRGSCSPRRRYKTLNGGLTEPSGLGLTSSGFRNFSQQLNKLLEEGGHGHHTTNSAEQEDGRPVLEPAYVDSVFQEVFSLMRKVYSSAQTIPLDVLADVLSTDSVKLSEVDGLMLVAGKRCGALLGNGTEERLDFPGFRLAAKLLAAKAFVSRQGGDSSGDSYTLFLLNFPCPFLSSLGAGRYSARRRLRAEKEALSSEEMVACFRANKSALWNIYCCYCPKRSQQRSMSWEKVWAFTQDFGLNPQICRKPLLEELFHIILRSSKKDGRSEQLSFHGLLQLLGRIACRCDIAPSDLTDSKLTPIQQLHKMLEMMELSGGPVKLSKKYGLNIENFKLKYEVLT